MEPHQRHSPHPILLSPPEAGPAERAALLEALESGWLAPAGPSLDAFESEVASVVGRRCGVAVSSGTAALHLALVAHGIGAGDTVLVSDLTFAASVNAIVYTGATPVLIDSDRSTWNMSVELLDEELHARRARPPKAAIVVDLYGQPADHDQVGAVLAAHGVVQITDAAESLGSLYHGRPSAAHGASGALSFNGNKIITTTGGGMFVTDDELLAARVQRLSTQARKPVIHYEHDEIGFNYRLSNLLAAFGRGQLTDLDRRVDRRRAIFDRYVVGLGHLPGIDFMPEAPFCRSNRWLTCITLDRSECGFSPEDLREHLAAAEIEARPTWKPMHQQPVFAGVASRLDGTSARIFASGLCLPSGSSLSDADQDRVIERVRELAGARA
jgi:dTDP-4-amino-4,6-dideoxygalactose transaminase